MIQLDSSFYYSSNKFLFARHNNDLFVTVKFPISSQRLPLKLYKVISLPVPTSENVTSKMQATQLLSLADYFVITPHHDYFLSLNSQDLADCVHGTSILCFSNWPQSPITVPDCTMALFANNVQQVKELCNFRYIQNALNSNIIELSPTSVLLYNTPTIVLDCPEEKKVLKGCAFCVFHIPCRCSLSTNTLFFAPRLVSCYQGLSNFSVIHPVNLALLQQFFDESKLSNLFGNTYFPTPINMSIPEFIFYNHTMHDVLADDHKAHLNLKKIANAVKKDQKIFKSLAEPLLDGQIEIPQEWPNTSDIITLVSLSLAGICFVLCILLCIKVRKICTTLLILKEVHHASSQNVPSFIYRKPSSEETLEDTSEEFIEFTWVHASVIISVIVLVILLIVMYLLYKSKSQKGSIIALELTSGGNCVIVPITHLSLCPSYYVITKPIISDISVSTFPSCKVIAKWSEFSVTDKQTQTTIQVPQKFSVNPFLHYKLHNILKQPFRAYVIIIHNKYAFHLQ